MDPTLGLGRRYALDAMDTGFELQSSEHVATGDGSGCFLVATQIAVGEAHHFEAPAVLLGITLIHPEQVSREQCRLIAAGAGANFEDRILFVGLVLWQQRDLHLSLPLRDLFLEELELFFVQGAHLGIVGAGDHFGEGVHLLLGPAQLFDRLNNRREVAQFL